MTTETIKQAEKTLAIAASMGPEWSTRIDGQNSPVITDGDLELYLHWETYADIRGRIKVGMSFNPRGLAMRLHSDEHSPFITVDGDRSPVSIASDIKRRMIPPARALQNKLRERQALADAYRARTDQLAAELADILGVAPGLHENTSRVYAYLKNNGSSLAVDIDCLDGYVNLKLSRLPVEEAREVCKILSRLPIS